MDNKVILQKRNVYGRDLVYPASTQAVKLAKLIDKKTFNDAEIRDIKSLGFEVTFIPSFYDTKA